MGWAQSPTEVRSLRLGAARARPRRRRAVLLRACRPGDAPDGRRLDAFWAGASIYAGSYVFGSNFDYRLAFLVLCVPQLCAWAGSGARRCPGARLALGIARADALAQLGAARRCRSALQTWYTGLSFPPEEVLNWLLFAWLVAAVAATAAPRACRGGSRRRAAT